MPFLLRLELPDIPGSLGRVASAIGEAGADIEAIQVVQKTSAGTVVDDVLLELQPGKMPDSVVSACSALDDVRVLWISRYAAGGNLFLDLEMVEEITVEPEHAFERMLSLMPVTFRVDWAVRARRGLDGVVTVVDSTEAAPETVEWVEIDSPARIDSDDENQVLCAIPSHDELIVVGRRGGPEFLDSEIARMDHLVGLTRSIHRTHTAKGTPPSGWVAD
ncbi:amino acid-binding protein [Nocardioides yefusunii]|uniref:Amino acid-binding protein n=1 Tax=Nocardioides yefusunii TaxID=2500546 RepID=A0ABW1R305_9ACTN|nr:amino acid-binding protein [Nocardioides yefusunii]